MRIKRSLFIVFTAALLFTMPLCGCSTGDPVNNNSGYITNTGLNDLRGVVGSDWGYMIVSGDAVFTSKGYYKYQNVVQRYLSGIGVSVDSERAEIYFARGEDSAYGIFLASVDGQIGRYYAFSINYRAMSVKTAEFGKMPLANVEVGSGGNNSCRLILMGNKVYAYSFSEMAVLADCMVEGKTVEDFSFFQKGNCFVAFTEDESYVYTYNADEGEFTTVKLSGNFSNAEYPLATSNAYFFSGEEGEYVSFTGGTVSQMWIDVYEENVYLLESGDIEAYGYTAYLNGDEVVVEYRDETHVITEEDILAVPQIQAIVQKRGQDNAPHVTSIKMNLQSGEIFIIVSNEPETFVGLRKVNDGVPQTALRYDFSSDTLTFCGLVDFTWYNVYLMIKL